MLIECMCCLCLERRIVFTTPSCMNLGTRYQRDTRAGVSNDPRVVVVHTQLGAWLMAEARISHSQHHKLHAILASNELTQLKSELA